VPVEHAPLVPRAAAADPPVPRSGAAAGPGTPVSGGEELSAAVITECPRTLGGTESVNRVIAGSCGPIEVTEDYHVNNGSLTLEAGATLRFREGAALQIGYNDSARLIVRGTDAAPVVFTAAGERVPGAWPGLRLHEHADRSAIDHLVVEYAGAGGSEAVSVDAQDVVLIGTTVRDAKGVGVGFGRHGTVAHFGANVFERIGGWPISLGPAAVDGIDGVSRLPAGSVVHVYGGTIEDHATWRSVGAPYLVTEDVRIDGASGERALLTVDQGVEVRLSPEAHILVGYAQPGALQTHGTEAAPVIFTGAGAGERWPWLRVYAAGEGLFAGTVFEHGGAPDSPGVVRVEGAVSLTGCTFRDDVGGLLSKSPRAKIKLLDESVFDGTDRFALLVYPQQLGNLGAANRYGARDVIEVLGGTVEETITWRAQRTLVSVLGDLRVDGRAVLTVESGSRIAMKDGTQILVGDRDQAALRLAGTADRPIEISGVRDEAASWGGVRLLDASRDSVIEHVRLRNCGESGGVVVEGEATASVNELTCARCAGPVLALSCGPGVQVSAIHADEGTPHTVEKPSCGPH
jgi:hypothetical protein